MGPTYQKIEQESTADLTLLFIRILSESLNESSIIQVSYMGMKRITMLGDCFCHSQE